MGLTMLLQIAACLGVIGGGAAQGPNGPAVDWIQRSPDGAYRFGYATGDEGRHYHVAAASADNTVSGKFGFKDPETGGDLQTTYTAGRRGFRARGPHIARHMDLSQNRPPFSRPNNDGKYRPELDNVFDPTEDRGYDFAFRSKGHAREEHANAIGDVQGRYSYLDDVGGRHHVEYIAGSRTGFLVTNVVPDAFAQAQAAPLFFVGKRPGPKARGYSAVQKGPDGSYRFAASGPDHKRSEVKDALGNVRGTYTYLDDKGVQHTVEYIAGPNIGYKVINNHKSPHYNPNFPYYPDVSSPVPPLVPTLPSLDSSPSPTLPTDNPTFPSTPLFTENPRPTLPPPTTLPPFSPSPTYPPTPSPYPTPPYPSPSYPSPSYPPPDPSWSYYDDFLHPKDWSKHTKIGSTTKVSLEKPYPPPPSPGYADFGYLHHDIYPDEGLRTAETGHGLKPEGGGTRPQGSPAAKKPFRGKMKYGGVRTETGSGAEEHFRLPEGVAVRAHVQSLDIVPHEKRYISPGEALDGFTSHSTRDPHVPDPRESHL